MPTLKCIETLLPPNAYSTKEAIKFYEVLYKNLPNREQQKAQLLFERIGIQEKHTTLPGEQLVQPRTLTETAETYKQHAILYATQVLQQALNNAQLTPQDIHMVLSTSCTGYMIPSFETYALNALGFSSNTKQLPVTEMGCAAGVSALIYANDYLRAYPHHRVAIVTLELPSNTLQINDPSMENLVATALFGDGIACAILEGDNVATSHVQITSTQMHRMPNTTDLLQYNLTSTGFKMHLSKDLPKVVQENYIPIATQFLQNNKLEMQNVGTFLMHPGGTKILDYADELLKPYGKNVDISRKIMQTYGNLSSATIMFILKEYLSKQPTNEITHVTSFGPGFNMQQVLLNIN